MIQRTIVETFSYCENGEELFKVYRGTVVELLDSKVDNNYVSGVRLLVRFPVAVTGLSPEDSVGWIDPVLLVE